MVAGFMVCFLLTKAHCAADDGSVHIPNLLFQGAGRDYGALPRLHGSFMKPGAS